MDDGRRQHLDQIAQAQQRAVREAQDTVSTADVQLLFDCVMGRFLIEQETAIVLAIEGLKWLLAEQSPVSRETLQREYDARTAP